MNFTNHTIYSKLIYTAHYFIYYFNLKSIVKKKAPLLCMDVWLIISPVLEVVQPALWCRASHFLGPKCFLLIVQWLFIIILIQEVESKSTRNSVKHSRLSNHERLDGCKFESHRPHFEFFLSFILYYIKYYILKSKQEWIVMFELPSLRQNQLMKFNGPNK